MRLGTWMFVLWIVVGCGASPVTGAPVCRPTQPNGDRPPGEEPGPTWYGNGRLYTALWRDGEILADPRYGQRFQATGIYFPAEGCYEITGQSGDAELTFVTKVTKVAAPAAGS